MVCRDETNIVLLCRHARTGRNACGTCRPRGNHASADLLARPTGGVVRTGGSPIRTGGDHATKKFNYVVTQLNQQQSVEVEDIITTPPEPDPYDQLKAELIRSLSTTPEQRDRQLLSQEELGDRKPSQFLRHLKGLAPDVPDEFLCILWAKRLPPHVQAILTGRPEDKLETASLLADKICEFTPPPTTAGVPTTQAPNNAPRSRQVDDPVQQVSSQQPHLSHTHPRPRERHGITSRDLACCQNSPPVSHGICCYHWHFGNQARNCKPPCSHQRIGPHLHPPHNSGNSAGRRSRRPTSASHAQAAS